MKVAILIGHYYPYIGGAEIFAQRLAEYLVKGGNKVDVITGWWDKELARTEAINGVKVHRVRILRIRHLTQITLFFPMFLRLLTLDRIESYDVFHSVGETMVAYTGAATKALRKKPHIITIQGTTLVTGLGNSPVGFILRKLSRLSLKRASLVHAISRELASLAERCGAENVIVVPNGVDMAEFIPMEKEKAKKKLDIPPDKSMVVCVARLVPVKGIDYLIRAIPLLSQTNNRISLLVIGDGPQRSDLEKLALELGIRDKVKFLGALPHEQIPLYLNVADVFVQSSLHEGLGIALIEAMSCGIPVIGTKVDGIMDIIEDNQNGFLVPPGDSKALAEAVKKILADEGVRSRFIAKGLETVKHKFQWDDVLPKIEEVYHSL